MLSTLASNHFSSHIDNVFRISFRGNTAAHLRLVALAEKPRSAIHNATRIPFSLLFCAENNQVISDSCFCLHHPVLGDLPDIYINRVLSPDPQDTRPYYQVVFN